MPETGILEYISALKQYKELAPFIVKHKKLDGREPDYSEPEPALSDSVKTLLSKMGIESLYSHQAEAINNIRAGQHTVVATPTASGKTMIYNLPVIEGILQNPSAKALYLFPLKALAQDQLKSINSLIEMLDSGVPMSAATYDGDTTSYKRGKIRKAPPNIILTNPEMLHLSILPFHDKWVEFITNLKYVIVDEVHTCRGVMGSHMAWVFRRLIRICNCYGAKPVFIFCSATIKNPQDLTQKLTGLNVKPINSNGAPSSGKHFLMLNTPDGASQSAIKLLHSALARGLRTIVYTQSRKMTELIAIWASERSGYGDKISAYRAGFLPEERRDIETKLANGELLAVISTSALEMGIDIGALDLCILVGYPGTIMATWQRAGRVGRKGRESSVILIGHEDALDQYVMNNPDEFFDMEPETAVINPHNPVIMKRHLECAAADLPFTYDEAFIQEPHIKKAVSELENTGGLLRSEDGELLFSNRKYPHRQVSLRGTGQSVEIVDTGSGDIIGSVDRHRAFHETYPGAVYLHRGKHYIIDDLDLEKNTAYAKASRVHYFTRARSNKTTEILELTDQRQVWSVRICLGKLKVTEQVTGYTKKLIKGQRTLGVIPLDLPPLVFETEGIWIEIPREIQKQCEDQQRHFMGGIHALEHAAIGILPLMIMTDRNDLGGISTPFHPQVGSGAVFVYDGFPGGVGLSKRAFELAEELPEKTMTVIESCKCDTGCPACVHSPKCGSGNRPIDKDAALAILKMMKEGPEKELPQISLDREIKREDEIPEHIKEVQAPYIIKNNTHFGVLDLETRRSAQEVGGWGNASRMGISCVVVYDSKKDDYIEYLGEEVSKLEEDLKAFDLVVGFNIDRFDYAVLNGNSNFDFRSLPTLDMLSEVYKRLGYRISLDQLGQNTLGVKKSADGLLALQWWKEGRIRDIIDYCQQDVKMTRDLYLFGQENQYLLFQNKAKMKVRVPVSW